MAREPVEPEAVEAALDEVPDVEGPPEDPTPGPAPRGFLGRVADAIRGREPAPAPPALPPGSPDGPTGSAVSSITARPMAIGRAATATAAALAPAHDIAPPPPRPPLSLVAATPEPRPRLRPPCCPPSSSP